jgi:endonuclease YncB( thermonuclease family)
MRHFFAFLLALTPIAQAAEWETLKNPTFDSASFTDGDSIPLVTEDGEMIINLYFIDAPETNDRYPDKINEQAQYWGRTVEETIAAGKAAGEFVRTALENNFVVETRRASIAGGTTPRYYGMIKIGDRYLSEMLVEAGFARVRGKTHELADGTSAAAFLEKLTPLENTAQTNQTGVWNKNGDIEIVVKVTPPETNTPPGVIILSEPATAYAEDGSFRALGTLKPGHKVKVVDDEPYLRVLIAVPGKKPIPALIKQSALK